MNHLDYNYIKHYNNTVFDAANISFPLDCRATFLCSIWCGLSHKWIDVYYQNSPTYQYIFVASEIADGISQVKMDSLHTIDKELRNRIVTEYIKVTGKFFPVEQKYQPTKVEEKYFPSHMTATEVSTKELAAKYNQMTLANLKGSIDKLKQIEEAALGSMKMDDAMVDMKDYFNKHIKKPESLNPNDLQPIINDPKNIPVTFKYIGYSCTGKLFPPLKSNTSVYWKLEDYKPFDIFTILNNLVKDYAYN